MGDDSPAVYVEGNKAVYRASALGTCETALVGLRMGLSPTLPPEWLKQKFEEGDLWEDYIVNEGVKEYGVEINKEGRVTSTQRTVEIDVVKDVIIRGHTDGDADFGARKKYGIEAKKLGKRLFRDWAKGPEYFFGKHKYYAVQLSLYMYALKKPFLYCVGEFDPDKGEDGEVVKVHTELITEPPVDVKDVFEKIKRVEWKAEQGELEKCDGSVSWPCPIYYLHEKVETRAEVDGRDIRELRELASAYHKAQQQEANGKKIKGEVKERLIQWLRDKGYVDESKGEVNPPQDVDGFLVTPYYHVSHPLNKKKLKDHGIDLREYKDERRTLTVRVKMAEKEAEKEGE